MRATRIGAAVLATGMATQAEAQFCETVDLNGCGCINVMDVLILLQMWGDQGGGCIADIDDSGDVDGIDLAYLLAHIDLWGDLDGCMDIPQAGSATAGVDDVTTDEDAAAGRRRYDVFVQLADPGDTLIGVYDATLFCSEPPCFFGGPLEDTEIAIGAMEAGIDPNFSLADFEAGIGVGVDAGWWVLAAPGTHPGRAGLYEENKVRVATFVTPESSDLKGELGVVWRTEGQELFTTTLQFEVAPADCYADFNGDGALNILDFVAYTDAWKAMDPAADCNGCGCFDIFQFICFQQMFQEGCP